MKNLREYYYETDSGKTAYVQLYDEEIERFNRETSVHDLRRINHES